jgi:hypothetical protein
VLSPFPPFVSALLGCAALASKGFVPHPESREAWEKLVGTPKWTAVIKTVGIKIN